MDQVGPCRGVTRKCDQDDRSDYSLRAAGVAAIWIGEALHIRAADVASVKDGPSRIVIPAFASIPLLSKGGNHSETAILYLLAMDEGKSEWLFAQPQAQLCPPRSLDDAR
jgi:hypothetical protein